MSKRAKHSNKIMIIAWIIVIIFAFFMYQADSNNANQEYTISNETLQRIKPVGEVNFEDSAISVAVSSTSRSGEEIYLSKCQYCHASGVLGAPKFGSKIAWEPLINRGIDNILKTAISGVNAMPAKGGCIDCSEAEIKSAIQHMIDNSN